MSDINKPKGESEKDAEREAEIVFQQHFIEGLKKAIEENSDPREVKFELRLPEEIFNKIAKRIIENSTYIYQLLGVRATGISCRMPDKLMVIDLLRERAIKFIFAQMFRKELEKVMKSGNEPVEVEVKLPDKINEYIKERLWDKKFITDSLVVNVNMVALQLIPDETTIIIKLSREEAEKALIGGTVIE